MEIRRENGLGNDGIGKKKERGGGGREKRYYETNVEKDRAAHASVRIMLAKTSNVCSRPSSADSIVSGLTVRARARTYPSLESNIKIIVSSQV